MSKKKNNIALELSEMKQITFNMLLLLGVYLYCSPAFALPFTLGTVVGSVLCSAVGLISYDIGRGLASLAVISLGVGAMLGRVTWGQAITVLAGIGGTIAAVVLAYAVMPLNLDGTLNSATCIGQGKTAQVQAAAAGTLWWAVTF